MDVKTLAMLNRLRKSGGAVALRERKADDPAIVGYGEIRIGSGGYG